MSILRLVLASVLLPGLAAAAPEAGPAPKALPAAKEAAPAARGPRAAIDPLAPPDNGRGLLAELFDDEKFEHKVKDRVDRGVDFLFDFASPDPDVPADHFAIRWTGFLRAPRAMRCKLVTYADDAAQVWLDGKLVLKGEGRKEALVELTGKPQPLKVELVEGIGASHVSLHWVVPNRRGEQEETVVPEEVLFHDLAAAARARDRAARLPKGRGLVAEIFDGEKFQKKVAERVDERLDFNWGFGTAQPGLKPDHFSVRWTTWLKAPRPGRYKLMFVFDDSVRAALDRKVIVDEWKGGRHRAEAFVEFGDKPLPLVVEYGEVISAAFISMHWEQDGGFKEQITPASAFFSDKSSAERAPAGAP